MANRIKMVQNFSVIIISALFVSSIYFFVNYFDGKNAKSDVDKSWVEGIGTLTKLDHGKSSASRFAYNYNGDWYENYSKVSLYVEGYTLGEKYNILINPASPEIYIPISWKPVFASDEVREHTKAKVLKVFRFRFSFNSKANVSSYGVRFKYTVGNVQYERGQLLPPDFKTQYPNLKKNQLYELEFLVKNPQRAIIHLDKPVTN